MPMGFDFNSGADWNSQCIPTAMLQTSKDCFDKIGREISLKIECAAIKKLLPLSPLRNFKSTSKESFVSQKEINDWISKNTFHCEKLHANISRQQCESLRSRSASSWNYKSPTMPFCCTKCDLMCE